MAEQPLNEAKVEKKTDENVPKEKKGKKKLIILIGGFLVLVLLALALISFIAPSLIPAQINPFSKGKTAEEKEVIPNQQGHIYHLESMIVNLADTEVPRYLKVKIDLESVEPKPNEEFDKRLPRLKDAVLTILTSKTYSQISNSQGKMELKEEILVEANQIFDKLKLKTVYFTEFVIQ